MIPHPPVLLRRAGTLLVALSLALGSASAQGAADSTVVTPIGAPRTPLPSEAATANITKFSFIAYGDTRGEFDGTYVNTPHMSVVASMIRTIQRRAGSDSAIKFVVQSGDAVADGRVIKQLNVSYTPVINQLTGIGDVPYFLAVGNHDVRGASIHTDPDRQVGLNNYFAANARFLPPAGSPRRLDGYPTYGIGYGNTFFLFYDSQIAGDTVQYNWIRKQLEGLDRRRYVNIVAVSHFPTYSSGPHGGARVEGPTAIVRDSYMPLFRKHHVKLLLTGHEHLFEHWVERYTDSTGAHRIDQIVTGGGGAPLYGYTGEPDLTAYRTKYAASRVSVEHLVKPSIEPGANPYHYVVVHVDGASMRFEVIAPAWGAGFQPYSSSRMVVPP
jgi:hypothetical protein